MLKFASFLTPRIYLFYTKEKLELVNRTVEYYTTEKRKSNEVVDEAVLEELKNVEKYYNTLTNNKALSNFKAMLKKKWSRIFVLSLPI